MIYKIWGKGGEREGKLSSYATGTSDGDGGWELYDRDDATYIGGDVALLVEDEWTETGGELWTEIGGELWTETGGEPWTELWGE